MNKTSKRARRMERRQQLRKVTPLNLVSLMDIFTILVFFLLVNSSTSQQLPNQKDLKLPTSIAQKAPKETLLLVLTKDSIIVQGREVAKIADVLNDEASEDIPALIAELKFLTETAPTLDLPDDGLADDEFLGQAITIVGDENAPYELIGKILSSCQQANFTQIAFAAMQKGKGS